METLRFDVRYAVRRLLKTPGFTIVAVVTLALGIGANSAIFSVIDAVLLKPLPYQDPAGLVGVFHLPKGGELDVMSPANFRDVRDQARTLSGIAAFNRAGYTLTGEGEPERLDAAQTSASFFEILGVKPLFGRTFRAEENEPGRNRVVVLSHGLWQQRFGADPNVLGKTISLNGTSHEIVGVMPSGFSYPARRQLWTPMEYDEYFSSDRSRGAWYLSVIGRLAPGATVEQAEAEVAMIGRRLEQQYPDRNTDLGFSAASLQEWMVGDIRPALMILLGAVGFVLLIACANVANLLLARATAREGELAVRTALGAGRGRLVRQLLTESIVLGLAGGLLGLLLASWGTDFVVALQPRGVPRLAEVAVDARVVGFTLGTALLTGILFGLVPAIQVTKGSLAGALKDSGRGSLSGRGGTRLRASLVVAEMALAVALLAGAGLLIRSFAQLQNVDPGFRSENRLTFRLALPENGYDNDPKRAAFYDQLLERAEALPGVRSAGAVSMLPLSGGNMNISFDVDGEEPARPGEETSMEIRVATPGYFATAGIPLLRGRGFSEADSRGAAQVLLLSETAARRYFPDEDPIGKRLTFGWGRGEENPRVGGEVIGIVGDVKQFGLDESEQPEAYVPHAQTSVASMAVVLATAVPPLTLADAVRREVRAIDPNLPLAGLQTFDKLVAESVSQPRFYMLLLGIFAGVALVLAAVGIFGVMSYAVAQRTREIGIRVALGADQGKVRWLVVRQAMVLAVAGVGLGIVAALAMSRVLGGLLFELSPTDPATFGTVGVLLTSIALLASYLPARRATRVDPMVALRSD